MQILQKNNISCIFHIANVAKKTKQEILCFHIISIIEKKNHVFFHITNTAKKQSQSSLLQKN